MQHRHRTRSQGVTLIECCVVLAIVGTLSSIAVPGMQSALESRRLSGAAAQLATDIHFVRTEAVARNRSVRLSFHASGTSSCYVAHTGAAAECSCSGAAAVCGPGAEQIKTVHLSPAEGVTLQANVASMVFDPLHGTTTPTGTLRVTAPSGRTVQHVVNLMGRVRSCSPSGAVPGYRAC